ncbi:MAG: hypothetical protein MUO36_02180 [Candidatus Hadarchaeum sp.]|nr:hypothetical protein [Candidatus Hadarchaeum sp.]
MGERKPKVYKVDVQRNHHDSRRLILRTVPRFNFRIAGAFIAFMFVLFGALVWIRGQEVGPWWTGVSASASPPPPLLPSVNIMTMGGSSNDPAWTIDVIGDENFRILSDSDVRLFIKYDGKVGIGTTDPSSLLSVGSTSQFQVDSSGAIVATTGITVSDGGTVDGVDISTIPSNYAGAETASRSIYVDHDTGSDSNGGASWGDAFQTLQHAVDNIKPIINDVTITVWARGVFDEGDTESWNTLIQKVCVGTGKIVLRADEWVEYASTTSKAAATLTYTKLGSEADDYWNGCIVWVTQDGKEQIRRITDTSVSGANVTITVDAAWNPALNASGDKFYIAGRAAIVQSVDGSWNAISVVGSYTYVEIYGFAFRDYGYTEAYLVSSTAGASLNVYNCAFYNSVDCAGAVAATYAATLGFMWSCSSGTTSPLYVATAGKLQIQGGVDYKRPIISGYVDVGVVIEIAGVCISYNIWLDASAGNWGALARVGGYGTFGDTYGNDGAAGGFWAYRFGWIDIWGVNELSTWSSIATQAVSIGETGANATMGIVTLEEGGARVETTAVTANSRIFLTYQVIKEDPDDLGILYVKEIVPGECFFIGSTGGANYDEDVAWLIIEPT